MKKAEGVHGSDAALAPAEVRMRFQRLLERAAAAPEGAAKTTTGPYLTISRATGSGGAEIAREVGRRLGWSVLDRELVEVMAEPLELEPGLLELMDETNVGWFSETLLNLLNSRLVLQDSFVSMASRVMALAAFEGKVVIVGRGGHLVLAPEGGLRVRVIAPHHVRVQAFAHREEIDERTAARRVDELDAAKEEFIRRRLHSDIHDPQNYDLVIDAAPFGLSGAVDLICDALEIRGFA